MPTYTDNLDTIRRMCGWMVKELGPDQPLHFSRFHPEHKLAHLTPTPVETLVKARDAARAEGLHYVYIGNVPGLEGAGTTWCPNCKKAVIERDIFAVTRMDLTDGKCRFFAGQRSPEYGIEPCPLKKLEKVSSAGGSLFVCRHWFQKT